MRLTTRIPCELVEMMAGQRRLVGALFSGTRTPKPAKGLVVIVHGACMNFYSTIYVRLGDMIARSGYTALAVNLSAHDLFSVDADFRPRWGWAWQTREDNLSDLAAWADFAYSFSMPAAFVGHSWGALLTALHAARDPRVRNLILLSPVPSYGQLLEVNFRDRWAEAMTEAKRLEEAGHGEDLIVTAFGASIPAMSARTIIEIGNSNSDELEEAVRTIQANVLVVRGSEEHSRLRTLVNRLARIPREPKAETAVIQGAGHFYAGTEQCLVATLTEWLDKVCIQTETRHRLAP